jgi:DNA-binding CsgD family transcriptional regulator
MMADGFTDKEICRALGMAYSTLRSTIRTRVMLKLGARTKPHAVALYLTDGAIEEMEVSDFGEDACSLSPREREVLLLCAKGLEDRAIAAALGLSINTVRSTYWLRSRAKLGAKNQAHAVALFLRGGDGARPT